MRRRGLLLALALCGACGARTGLLADEVGVPASEDGGPEGATSDGQVVGDGGPGPINCALHVGPVDSCDAGAGGPVLRCPSGWTCEYVNFVRLWGCCNAKHDVCGYADPPIQGCPK